MKKKKAKLKNKLGKCIEDKYIARAANKLLKKEKKNANRK